MELRDLEYFLACVETGSLTAAARRSFVAQPTLSHALARLEREVDARLLERSPHRSVQLTAAGALLAVHARAALRSVAAFHQELSAQSGALCGTLRITATSSLTATFLPKVLATLARTHPGLELLIHTRSSARICGAVRTGRAEIGLLPAEQHPMLRGLSSESLYEEQLVAVSRKRPRGMRGRRLRVDELQGQPLLLSPPGTVTWNIVHRACRKLGFEPTVRLTLASAEALRETARAGLGIAILPEGYVQQSDPDLTRVRLDAPALKRDVLIVRPSSTDPPLPALRVLLETMQRLAKG